MSTPECSRPEMTVDGPFNYCDDSSCPAHGVVGPLGSTGRSAGPLLRYFSHDHLKRPLKSVSEQFAGLASWLDARLPDGSEKTVALRKLLEAKDAAVRSVLDLPEGAQL